MMTSITHRDIQLNCAGKYSKQISDINPIIGMVERKQGYVLLCGIVFVDSHWHDHPQTDLGLI